MNGEEKNSDEVGEKEIQIENKWHSFCRLNGDFKRIHANEAKKKVKNATFQLNTH